MEKIKAQINAYYTLRKRVKKAKYDKKQSNSIINWFSRSANSNSITDCFICFITTKMDMLIWKNYYEYNESILSNTFELKKWESKINIKIQNEPKPTFRILNTINQIKNNLIRGISIISQEFLTSLDLENMTNLRQTKCYIGNNKILLDFNDLSSGHFLICKIGNKQSIKYITFDNIKPYNNDLINEILETKEEKLLNKEYTPSKSNCIYNICYRININKPKKNKQKENNIIQNKSMNNNNINKNLYIADLINQKMINP